MRSVAWESAAGGSRGRSAVFFVSRFLFSLFRLSFFFFSLDLDYRLLSFSSNSLSENAPAMYPDSKLENAGPRSHCGGSRCLPPLGNSMSSQPRCGNLLFSSFFFFFF